MNIIEVQGVTKTFGSHTALDDLTLSIGQGRIFGLLGPNGAGKTTLIRILTCINEADSGTVFFHGHPIEPKDVANIGYLPEERGLYKKMKVSEQGIYFARLRGMSKAEAEASLHAWFQKFQIESWWNRRVEELSKGMQQKLQFITTVVHRPDFIIFDEPFSGFDPINAEQLKQEILELKKNGATIILSTHNMASVEEICDDIALINRGKLLLNGPVGQVRRQFRENQYAITFNGTHEGLELPDWVQLVAHESDEEATTIKVKLDEQRSANDLLQLIIPQRAIAAFSEILPSMNDVFIRSIQANKDNK